MKNRFHLNPALRRVAWAFAASLLATVVEAQVSLTDIGSTAPTPGPNDISQFSTNGNQSNPGGLDYNTDIGWDQNFYFQTSFAGQSFTTGSLSNGYILNSVSIRTAGLGGDGEGFSASQSFTLNIYALSGAGLTNAALLESYVATATIDDGDWIQWTNLTPQMLLAPNTVYAYGFGRSFSGFGSYSLGVATNNPYPGGQIGVFPTTSGPVTYGSSGNFDATFDIGLAQAQNLPQSALGWFNLGYTTNGVYMIDPGGPGPIAVNCLMTLAGGGWTELTDEVASSALNTNTNTIRSYLYVQNATDYYYRTPATNLVWSWTSGKDLYGTYYYSTGGPESNYAVTPSDEHESYGVGGSSGPGDTYKCLVIYPDCLNSSMAQVQLCQDMPGIFGHTCQCGVTVYLRENVTAPPAVAPVITQEPPSLTKDQGVDVSLRVAATGTEPLAYQWQFDGANLPGATNTTLSLTNVQTSQAGTYVVTVTNAFGSATSSNATLTVYVPPSITKQPLSVITNQSSSLAFSVGATGTPAVNYQWEFNGTPITGATNASCTAAILAGYYSVMVSNAAGSTMSGNASLTFFDQSLYAGLTLRGPSGSNFAIQAIPSLDETNWTTLTNATLNSIPFFYLDLNSPTNSIQFYRAVPLR